MVVGGQEERPHTNGSQPAVLMDEWSYGPHEMRAWKLFEEAYKYSPGRFALTLKESLSQWQLKFVKGSRQPRPK